MLLLTLFGAFEVDTYGVLWASGSLLILEYVSPRFVAPDWFVSARRVLYILMIGAVAYTVYKHLVVAMIL